MVGEPEEGEDVNSGRRWVILGSVAVSLLLLIGYLGFRAKVRAVDMIDQGSVGVDYLKIAYGGRGDQETAITLILASEHFARLGTQLDHWAWIEAATVVVPIAHDQFEMLEAVAEAGSALAAAPLVSADRNRRFAGRGTRGELCEAADHLLGVRGTFYSSLKRQRVELITLIRQATQDECGSFPVSGNP